jgi:predicted SAM-dependent methyltransferase
MKIEFGCGETPTKDGFKTCDIRDLPGIDFVCESWHINKYVEENSVDEIFSRHFFEHLTFQQGEVQLEVWYNILKPGGLCEMVLPNMSYHINQWINRTTPRDIKHAKAGFWGWQRGKFDDVWDIHKSGYDKELLSELVKTKGFVDLESTRPVSSKHLHLKFYKPYLK